jgi:hypothetical protein
MISELVLNLGANMHYNNSWLNNRYEVGDTAKYSHHDVLVVLIPEQEDSSCLQLIHWKQTNSKFCMLYNLLE